MVKGCPGRIFPHRSESNREVVEAKDQRHILSALLFDDWYRNDLEHCAWPSNSRCNRRPRTGHLIDVGRPDRDVVTGSARTSIAAPPPLASINLI